MKSGEKAGPRMSSEYAARLRVVKASRRRALLEWTFTEGGTAALADQVDARIRPAMEKLDELVEGLTVRYSTDRAGRVRRIENGDELGRRALRVVETVEEEVGGGAAMEVAVRSLRKLMRTESFVQNALAQEVQLLHGGYGMKLKAGESRTLPYEVPNPYGGRPLPAKARESLVAARDDRGCAVVEVAIDVDPKAFARVTAEALSDLSGREVDPAQFGGMRMRNLARYTYDPGERRIVRVDASKTVEADGRRRVERVVIASG